ncbi:hypothetical protein RFI_37037, partial [Reticulomyxa filosa]
MDVTMSSAVPAMMMMTTTITKRSPYSPLFIVNYFNTLDWCCVHQYLDAATVDVCRRELMLLCAIDYKKQQRRVNQSIIGSTTQKSLHYLANQNKGLDIDNVLVALGPAEWIYLDNILYQQSSPSLLSQRNRHCGYERISRILDGGIIIIEINAHSNTTNSRGCCYLVDFCASVLFPVPGAIIRSWVHCLKKFFFICTYLIKNIF